MNEEEKSHRWNWLKPVGLLFLQLVSVWFGFQLHSCAIESSVEREKVRVSSALRIEIAQNDKVIKDLWYATDETEIGRKAKEMVGGSLAACRPYRF